MQVLFSDIFRIIKRISYMYISDDFYKSEVMDGFYVPSIMKRSWAAMLEILNDVSKVCARNGIKWWIDYGTLLGMVRHGGFIPWDDDVDIAMLRKDYMKFIEVAEFELPKGYKVIHFYNSNETENYLIRVVNSEGVRIDPDYLNKFHGFPFVTGIDIFAYDYINRDTEIEEETNRLVDEIDLIAKELSFDVKLDDVPFLNNKISDLEKKHGIRFHDDRYLKQQLLILCDTLYASTEEYASDEIAIKYDREKYKYKFTLPKNIFSKLFKVPYQSLELSVPYFYSYILEREYGNFMCPIRDGSDHDFPVYMRQQRVMCSSEMKHIFWNRFIFDKTDIRVNDTAKEVKNGDVVFLVSDPENWQYMEKEYDKYKNEAAFSVYVIPIPYFVKDNCMNFKEMKIKSEGFPEWLSITKPDEYDFFGCKPGIVYYDNPYDNYDGYISVYPLFYSDKIRLFAQKMIYISCIITDEYTEDDKCAQEMMSYCILTPGVSRADEIIVQSENMRQRYIDALTGWAGEETANIWNNKIKVISYIKMMEHEKKLSCIIPE